jgi:hypothetical protein
MAEIVNGGWMPHVAFNPVSGDSRAFKEVEETFYQWRITQSPKALDELGVTIGFVRVTPEIAEQLLLRNTKNRQINFGTMRGYALDIMAEQWKKTGQTVIVGKSGRLLDGAHRLWACYLTGIAIDVFVVLEVDDIEEPNLFAYIDQIRKRSGGDALATAGRNGLSERVSNVIMKFAKPDAEGVLSLDGRPKGYHVSTIDVLDYDTSHPDLNTITHLIDRQYKGAVSLLQGMPATYLAYQIFVEHGYPVLHSFMQVLCSDTDSLPVGHPVRALYTVMELDKKARVAGKDTKKGQAARANMLRQEKVLAYAITAFNLTLQRQSVDKLSLPLQEFPHVVKRADLSGIDAAAAE